MAKGKDGGSKTDSVTSRALAGALIFGAVGGPSWLLLGAVVGGFSKRNDSAKEEQGYKEAEKASGSLSEGAASKRRRGDEENPLASVSEKEPDAGEVARKSKMQRTDEVAAPVGMDVDLAEKNKGSEVGV